MSQHRDFADGNAFPAGAMDAVYQFLSTLPGGNFALSLSGTTIVQVVASAGAGQAVIALGGQVRFNTATASATHPGGAAATYDIFATASVLNTAQEDANTYNYAFGLKIVAAAATPSGVGAEAVYRKVGSLIWDGAAITGIQQDPGVGGVGPHQIGFDAVTADKLDDTTALVPLGLNSKGSTGASVVRRGKSIILGTGTRANAAYGALDGGAAPGPDQVPNLVLPTSGLIGIAFQSTWQQSGATAKAAIFLNAVQLQIAGSTGGTVGVQEASAPSTASRDTSLYTTSEGLGSLSAPAAGYPGDATTGQIIGRGAGGGGALYVFAAAGTYTVSIQWIASTGTVSVKDRKLWAWTVGF